MVDQQYQDIRYVQYEYGFLGGGGYETTTFLVWILYGKIVLDMGDDIPFLFVFIERHYEIEAVGWWTACMHGWHGWPSHI